MGIFFKTERQIVEYNGNYLLTMKFKRFGNSFYMESTSREFLYNLSDFATYYVENIKKLKNINFENLYKITIGKNWKN